MRVIDFYANYTRLRRALSDEPCVANGGTAAPMSQSSARLASWRQKPGAPVSALLRGATLGGAVSVTLPGPRLDRASRV